MPHKNHISPTGTWQRLALCLFGLFLLAVTWYFTIGYLYTLPVAAIAGYVSITTNFFYTVAAIIIFMITGRLVYEWKMNTSQIQNVVSQAENIVEEFKGNPPKTVMFDDGKPDLDSD